MVLMVKCSIYSFSFVYQVSESLKDARAKSQMAEKLAKEAGEQMPRKEEAIKAKDGARELKQKLAQKEAEIQVEMSRMTKMEEKMDVLGPALENMKTEFDKKAKMGEEMRSTLVDMDSIRDKAEQAHQRVAPLNESFLEMGTKLEDVDKRVANLMNASGGMAGDTETAKDQIQQVHQ
jgi:DNA repair ATPase RecN